MPRPRLIGIVPALFLCATFVQAQTPKVQGTTIPVDSPAFVFSPGNWTGDQGRGGSIFRQSWYPGSYCRVTWTTANPNPVADILLDTSTFQQISTKPQITYNVDGYWTDGVVCGSDDIQVAGLKGAGTHTLTIYFKTSDQTNRWGSIDSSGKNVLRIKGVRVDAGSTPETSSPSTHWALIVGDSITEGSAADFGKSDNLSDWSYLVGQGLQMHGYEYGVNACGWSGWIRPGDKPPGDVPPYYFISGSTNGSGGSYDDARSRWNKIDAGKGHGLLDANNHLSAFGGTGQEPSLIIINYGTNDDLSHSNPSDIQASITQSLVALRGAAPEASIYLIVPFGQYATKELHDGLAAYQTSAPLDKKVFLIDLGKSVANSLHAGNYMGGLHPNLRGHAVFAIRILSEITIP